MYDMQGKSLGYAAFSGYEYGGDFPKPSRKRRSLGDVLWRRGPEECPATTAAFDATGSVISPPPLTVCVVTEEPTKPDPEPTQPDTPTQPEKPTEPDKPTTEPDTPTQPDKPTRPEEPEKPAEPEPEPEPEPDPEPEKPDAPTQPDEPEKEPETTKPSELCKSVADAVDLGCSMVSLVNNAIGGVASACSSFNPLMIAMTALANRVENVENVMEYVTKGDPFKLGWQATGIAAGVVLGIMYGPELAAIEGFCGLVAGMGALNLACFGAGGYTSDIKDNKANCPFFRERERRVRLSLSLWRDGH